MVHASSKTFKKSEKRPIVRVTRPFQAFIKSEAISGILLIISVIVALLWRNIFPDHYYDFWHIDVTLNIGTFLLSKPLVLWIDELLMTFFFLLVGLEIKRELLIGELSSLNRALLPTVAAIGGMVVPALVYLAINPPGSIGARGWAVPMATDIAFALGILYLLGKRVPTALRILLASLAIVDDIGAVLVIAFFYSEDIKAEYLLYSLAVFLLLIAMNRLGVRRVMLYIILGLVLWYFVFKSGVHATITGVVLSIVIPATTEIDYNEFRTKSTSLIDQMNKAAEDPEQLEGRLLKIYQNTVHTLEKTCGEVVAPLQTLEHQLTPLVVFLIMPLFAISNSGVLFDEQATEVWSSPITYGIILGLYLGKPIGIFSTLYIADKYNLITMPQQVNWYHILGMGFLAGIGFTMSTFISALAFPATLYPKGLILAITKISILVASLLSALTGIAVLIYASKR